MLGPGQGRRLSTMLNHFAGTAHVGVGNLGCQKLEGHSQS